MSVKTINLFISVLFSGGVALIAPTDSIVFFAAICYSAACLFSCLIRIMSEEDKDTYRNTHIKF